MRNFCHFIFHFVHVRCQFRFFGDNGYACVDEAQTFFVNGSQHLQKKLCAVRALVFFVVRREEMTYVRKTCRRKNGVHERVQRSIGVAVSRKTFFKRDFHSAKQELSAFCETVKKAGYEPGVYFNRYIGYYGFDLSRLNSYKFWLAVPGDFPDFYYAFDIWQYSFEETIPGIETPTDMNLMFIPKVQPSPSPSAEATPAA